MDPDHASFSRGIALSLFKAARTKSKLNNQISILSIEAELPDDVTSDHISSDMDAISDCICEALFQIRNRAVSEGTPPRIVAEAMLNAMRAYGEIISGLREISLSHPPTVKACKAYFNANLADSNSLLAFIHSSLNPTGSSD
jgi:hypothetical protein